MRKQGSGEAAYTIASEQYLDDTSNIADYLHAGARSILAAQSKLVEVEEEDAMLPTAESTTLRASAPAVLKY